ncbi:striatin-3-like isoform X2, partial [Leptotrombidium deliense]
GQQSQAPQQQQYTIPGILHFLQYEWQRFELERQQWDIERTELQARIALLQAIATILNLIAFVMISGERKGQENLKNDLVRRIKMLEYCLRQERAKYHKLKYGVDPPQLGGEDTQQFNNDPLLEESVNGDVGQGSTSGAVNWKHGRQLLRQYLQEIGYTDTIIDVRSNRVRSLLGLNNTTNEEAMHEQGKNVTQSQAKQTRRQQQSPATSMVTDAEASVLATFEFLNEQSRDHSRNSGVSDDDDDVDDEEEDIGEEVDGRSSFPIDSETEEVLAEFDFLSAHQRDQDDATRWRSETSKNDIVDIGELAALTVANESLDMNGSNTNTSLQNSLNTEFRKTWNPRYILKSHFDCVRCLRFHSTERLLVTCSEDETLKLWNLNKTQQQSNKGNDALIGFIASDFVMNTGKQTNSSGGTTFDLEPIYTFRGHTSRVLCLTLINNQIYSGAQNGELLIWSIPANIANIDPYDAFDSSLSVGSLEGHTDAIWSLDAIAATSSSSNPLLCSASADSTIKIWETDRHQCVKTISLQDESAQPTCVVSIPPHNNNNATANSASLLAISFTDGSIYVYDIESTSYSQPILKFDKPEGSSRINSIVVHPTMPVIVSAHENRQIQFWDLNTGKCINAMVAHLDEVTCLACDPNGLYLLSG